MISNPGLALVFTVSRSLVGPENFRPLSYSNFQLSVDSSVGIYYFCFSFKIRAIFSKNQLIQNQSLLSRLRFPALWTMWLLLL